MKPSSNKNHKVIAIYLKQDEYQKLQQALANTTHRSMNEYVKKLIFGKPVTVTYRDRSFDEFIDVCIQFKKDLDIILSNGRFTDAEILWLTQEIKTIKDLMVQLYDYVRNNKKH
jgi:hypothetical protein